MELELTRIDYTVVGVSSTGCMKILPSSGPKELQKVKRNSMKHNPYFQMNILIRLL